MLAVFDGHNDAITREDRADLARGRQGGHLDLPRMRAGGVRGGIFAVFTESPGKRHTPVPRGDGVLEFERAQPVAYEHAAADAGKAAGRLLALERTGDLRIARRAEDLDAARHDKAPPVAVLHL